METLKQLLAKVSIESDAILRVAGADWFITISAEIINRQAAEGVLSDGLLNMYVDNIEIDDHGNALVNVVAFDESETKILGVINV